MLKYILIDLDDTLLDFQKGSRQSIIKMLKKYHFSNLKLGMKVYSVYNQKAWREIEKGADENEVLTKRFVDTFAKANITVDGDKLNQEYLNLISNNFYLMPGARKLLDKLIQMNFKLVAVTNGVERNQIKRLKGTGLINKFDVLWISQDIGVSKPAPLFFNKLFHRYSNINRHNSIMIGDGLNSDILGANNVHIPSIWYINHAQQFPRNIQPNYIVTNLKQIPMLLQNIKENY